MEADQISLIVQCPTLAEEFRGCVETPPLSTRHFSAIMSRFNPNASAFNPNAAAFDPNAAAFGFPPAGGQQFGQGMPFGMIPGMPQEGVPQGEKRLRITLQNS